MGRSLAKPFMFLVLLCATSSFAISGQEITPGLMIPEKKGMIRSADSSDSIKTCLIRAFQGSLDELAFAKSRYDFPKRVKKLRDILSKRAQGSFTINSIDHKGDFFAGIMRHNVMEVSLVRKQTANAYLFLANVKTRKSVIYPLRAQDLVRPPKIIGFEGDKIQLMIGSEEAVQFSLIDPEIESPGGTQKLQPKEVKDFLDGGGGDFGTWRLKFDEFIHSEDPNKSVANVTQNNQWTYVTTTRIIKDAVWPIYEVEVYKIDKEGLGSPQRISRFALQAKGPDRFGITGSDLDQDALYLSAGGAGVVRVDLKTGKSLVRKPLEVNSRPDYPSSDKNFIRTFALQNSLDVKVASYRGKQLLVVADAEAGVTIVDANTLQVISTTGLINDRHFKQGTKSWEKTHRADSAYYHYAKIHSVDVDEAGNVLVGSRQGVYSFNLRQLIGKKSLEPNSAMVSYAQDTTREQDLKPDKKEDEKKEDLKIIDDPKIAVPDILFQARQAQAQKVPVAAYAQNSDSNGSNNENANWTTWGGGFSNNEPIFKSEKKNSPVEPVGAQINADDGQDTTLALIEIPRSQTTLEVSPESKADGKKLAKGYSYYDMLPGHVRVVAAKNGGLNIVDTLRKTARNVKVRILGPTPDSIPSNADRYSKYRVIIPEAEVTNIEVTPTGAAFWVTTKEGGRFMLHAKAVSALSHPDFSGTVDVIYGWNGINGSPHSMKNDLGKLKPGVDNSAYFSQFGNSASPHDDRGQNLDVNDQWVPGWGTGALGW